MGFGLPAAVYEALVAAPESDPRDCPCCYGLRTERGDALVCRECEPVDEDEDLAPLPHELAWEPEHALLDPIGDALDCDDEVAEMMDARAEEAVAHQMAAAPRSRLRPLLSVLGVRGAA